MDEDDLWSRRALLGGLALAGLCPARPAFAQAATAAGEVRSLTGQAVAELRERSRVLSLGGEVFVGDQVATAERAQASLLLGRDTLLKMSERARITIDRFLVEAGGVISLGAGAVLIDKTPRPGAPSLRIRSSFGVIAVRGTQFFAARDGRGFSVFVARGSVSVEAAGRAVILNPGEGVDILRRGAPPGPVQRWPQARVDAALARFA